MLGVDDIIDELSWRGLIAVSTDIDELREALNSRPDHDSTAGSTRPRPGCTSGTWCSW